MQPIPVTAALIRRGARILIAQRKPDAAQALLWEFPGGKVHFGERPEDGLVREIEEELALPVRVDSLFAVESHVYEGASPKHILLLAYNCTPLIAAEPRTVDVHAFAWVAPAEMERYAFAPADWAIVRKLGGKIGNTGAVAGEKNAPAES